MKLLQKMHLLAKFKLYAWLRLNRFESYNLSCSQFGEDMIVRSLLPGKRQGFFVDVGAHHPVLFSNTYHFYCKGWRGINIDATPGSMEAFDVLRPRDINLERCVDSVVGRKRVLLMYEQTALNRIVDPEEEASSSIDEPPVVARTPMVTTTLQMLLDEYLPPNQDIDLLNIDIEGLDSVVLGSHDFQRYRPKLIVFEKIGGMKIQVQDLPMVQQLDTLDYFVAGMTGHSIIMMSRC